MHLTSRFRVSAFFTQLGLLALLFAVAHARQYDPKGYHAPSSSTSAFAPDYCYVQHNVGEVVLDISDLGIMGWTPSDYHPIYFPCFPDVPGYPPAYPKGGQGIYEGAWGLWIGGIRGNDTLVSTVIDYMDFNYEFAPDEAGSGRMLFRTTLDPENPANRDAISEQDFVATYTDTATSFAALDAMDNRPHRPLGLLVRQSSYAWSYGYAEDIVLFNFDIWNISGDPLSAVYIGIQMTPRVYHSALDPFDVPGDLMQITGLIREYPNYYGECGFTDTLNVAWHAHYDGHFLDPNPFAGPVPHVAGLLLMDDNQQLSLSYNWWINEAGVDWGPRSRRKFRDLGTGGLGSPVGDRNKYYFMRNGEVDYDLLYTGTIEPDDPVWLYPPFQVSGRGFFLRPDYLLSLGPYNLDPGERISVPLAFVMGKDLHSDPYNFRDNIWNADEDSLSHYDPDAFYANLNFSDLVKNARWAKWIYDNPGVDTDSDGYAGKYHLCCTDSTVFSVDSSVTPWDTVWQQGECDKIWYQGDGVPDWKAVSPPPAPEVRVKPDVGSIHVYFNGTYSETARDIFTQTVDFEGYRVYYSRDARKTSYTLLASYDHENYDKYVWLASRGVWELNETPYTMEHLRCLYGDSCNDPYFNPLDYTRGRPYIESDSIFYFAAHDFNQSLFGINTAIHKVYPDQPYPSSLIPDSAQPSELTEEGLLKYFEYEFTIENVLPTVQYYVNVTAFDFGAPGAGVSSMETAVTLHPVVTYPLPDGQDVVEKNLRAYVYPNPYRIDADYFDKGFEGRDAQYYIPERLRRIHFANLPPKCTISIFTLDGDLVRRLDHDKDPSDPAASHDTWDLITRNTQSVVSGIYYWTVEQPGGETQIGKLVIIK